MKVIVNDPIDYELLRGLYCDPDDLQHAWPGAKYPFCEQEWSKFIRSRNRSVSLLFRIQELYVGHVLLIENERGQLYLCFVLLLKEYRGQGLIYSMLKEIETFAKDHFIQDELYLHVDPENYPALKAYERQGYQQIAITAEQRFRMRKKLSR